jgi:hypothetical protein
MLTKQVKMIRGDVNPGSFFAGGSPEPALTGMDKQDLSRSRQLCRPDNNDTLTPTKLNGWTFMKKIILLPILLLFILPPIAGAQELIKKGETLELQRCVEIALKKHPGIQAAASTLKAGESRVGQAKAGYYPQVSGSASYSRTDQSAAASRFSTGGSVYDSY